MNHQGDSTGTNKNPLVFNGHVIADKGEDLCRLHPDISKQLSQADIAIEEVRKAADYLAELMRSIHGGSWRVQIEHEVALIVIAARPDRQSKSGHRGISA